MCRAVKCSKCGKTTWAGCGAHVAQVMAGVPAADQCRCREASEKSAEAPRAGGFLSGLFGRR